MRLVDNLKDIEDYYLIISGNGTFPERVIFKNLCKKFNGYNKAIFYINPPLKKQTGLHALNALPLYPKKYHVNSIIFILDGEHIQENAKIEIQRHLESIGIGISEIIPLQRAFLIKCNSGPYEIFLFCTILGPEIFIEEEVANLIKLKLGVTIDLSQRKESAGRKLIKNKLKKVLRERGKTIEELISDTRKTKLEEIFPNICAVLKELEGEQ